MPRVTVQWGPDHQLLASAREHQLVIDRSPDGKEASLRSGELLLMALGACTAGTLLNHSLVRTMPIRDLRVELSGDRLGPPSHYGNFRVSVIVDGDLTEAQRATVLRVARGCTIHNTLRSPREISVELVTTAASATSEPAPSP